MSLDAPLMSSDGPNLLTNSKGEGEDNQMTNDGTGALAFHDPDQSGIIVALQTGKDRYQQLAAARLKAARLAAGWDEESLAAGLSDVLGVAVTVRQVVAWESGAEEYAAGVMPAAYDVMGISEAALIGLDNPDIEQVNRLAVAVSKVRALLNDPAALARRVSDLMEGKAKSLLVVGVIGLTALRMAAGPPAHVGAKLPRHSSAAVAAARYAPG